MAFRPNGNVRAGTALAALVLVGCGGGNNRPTTTPTRPPIAVSPVATRTAAPGGSTAAAGVSTSIAAVNSTPIIAACSAPTGTRPPPTFQPIPTPNPDLSAAFLRLSPLLLKTADLPPALRDFQGSDPLPVSNQDYVRGQANADCLSQALDGAGRTGGAIVSWGKAGTYVPGQHTPTALLDTCSQFRTPDGARQGLEFVFSQASNPPQTNPNARLTVGALDAGSYGDETRAIRADNTGLVSANSASGGTPVVVNARQTFFNITWRRGTAVCSVQEAAIDEDPSLADLKALAQLQDQRLKDAGY